MPVMPLSVRPLAVSTSLDCVLESKFLESKFLLQRLVSHLGCDGCVLMPVLLTLAVDACAASCACQVMATTAESSDGNYF